MDMGSIVESILWIAIGIVAVVNVFLIIAYFLLRSKQPKLRHTVRMVRLAPGTELHGAVKIEGFAMRPEGAGGKIEWFASKPRI